MSNKTLSFGCILIDPSGQEMLYVCEDENMYHGLYGNSIPLGGIAKKCNPIIKGHKLTIGDVMRRLSLIYPGTGKTHIQLVMEVCNLRIHKRDSIESQSDECVDYIFNLLD